jgi:hypothetical protein
MTQTDNQKATFSRLWRSSVVNNEVHSKYLQRRGWFFCLGTSIAWIREAVGGVFSGIHLSLKFLILLVCSLKQSGQLDFSNPDSIRYGPIRTAPSFGFWLIYHTQNQGSWPKVCYIVTLAWRWTCQMIGCAHRYELHA